MNTVGLQLGWEEASLQSLHVCRGGQPSPLGVNPTSAPAPHTTAPAAPRA